MRPPQKILAIVDPTATEQSALDKAALWAKKFHANSKSSPATLRARRCQCFRRTLQTPLHAGLLRKIKESDTDLVVKDTHHHDILHRTLLSNTDWHLIRNSQAPLLLVKPAPWTTQARVLACIDPEREADKPAALDIEILSWAAALSGQFGGDLHSDERNGAHKWRQSRQFTTRRETVQPSLRCIL